MTDKWKPTNEISEEELSSPLIRLMNFPPKKYIQRKERYCPFCNNCETSIRNIKQISKYLKKNYVQKVIEVIEKNNLVSFDRKQLIDLLDPKRELTIGTLQLQALAILVALGYLKKEIISYINKKKETHHKYLWHLNENIIIPFCYNPNNDSHDDVNWDEKRYFQ
jgi:hypothetical protein